MKKRLLLLMVSVCILCAASLKYLSNEKAAGESTAGMETAQEAVGEIADEAAVLRTAEEKTEEQTEEQEASELIPESWEDGYAYQSLSADDRKVYREIYGILASFAEEQPISLTDPERLSDLFQCVLNDHPEIFYVQGYTYSSYMQGEKIVKIALSGTYTMTPEEAALCQEGIDAYVNECLAGLNEDASDYEKVKYIYEYLINHTQYNLAARENQNICSVFLFGESVCQGYAKATQYLLQKAGVFCTLVIGSVSEGEGHAWNLVRMDGNYYYVDTTWGDASYQREEGEKDKWITSFPEINYDYLGVTTQQLLRTHILNNVVPLPECVSMDCNYYVKEGVYLTDCNNDLLQQLFALEFWNNGGFITLKASDGEVYERMKQLLISEQRVFEYIGQTDGTIAYSNNDEQFSLSFWILT